MEKVLGLVESLEFVSKVEDALDKAYPEQKPWAITIHEFMSGREPNCGRACTSRSASK